MDPILFQPRKPFHRRGRSAPPAAAPAPAPAVVVSVVALPSAYEADWIFAAPVTLLGTDAPELEIDGEGEGFIGPDSVMQINATTIRGAYFSSSGIEAGNAWRVLAPPAHITPGLAAPQSGNLV